MKMLRYYLVISGAQRRIKKWQFLALAKDYKLHREFTSAMLKSVGIFLTDYQLRNLDGMVYGYD